MKENLTGDAYLGIVLKKLPHIGFWLYPVAVCSGLAILFGYNGLYGQDGHEYLRYCREILASFQGAPLESNFFWPVGYPLFGAILAYLLRSPELAMITISVLSLGGTSWVTWILLKKLYPDRLYPKALFVFLFLTMAPFMMKAGLVVMSDMLAAFFVISAYWAFASLVKKLSRRAFMLFVVLSAFAVLTRYPVGFLLLIPTLWVIFLVVRSGKITWLLLGAIAALACLSPHFLLKGGGDWMPNKPLYLDLGWKVKNFFLSEFHTPEGVQNYRLPNLLYAFGNFYHPGYIFAGLVLLLFLRLIDFKGIFIKITLAGIVIYAIFLAGMAFQNQRFLVISFPLVLLILYPAFSRIWETYCPKWMKGLVWIAVFILQFGLFYYAFNPILERNQLERNLVKMVQKHQPGLLYTFDVEQALNTYRVTSEIKNLWLDRYAEFVPGSMVLFNEKAFSTQWEGHNPMINWEELNAKYLLQPIDSINNGWHLYQIYPSKEGEE